MSTQSDDTTALLQGAVVGGVVGLALYFGASKVVGFPLKHLAIAGVVGAATGAYVANDLNHMFGTTNRQAGVGW